MTLKPTTAYLAPIGFEKQLESELEGIIARYDRLFLTDQKPIQAFWAQNIWLTPFIENIESISKAANLLKSIQRNWAYFPFSEHRKAALIQEKLPFISKKAVVFPMELPQAPMGSFTLLDKTTLIASGSCSSPFANGEIIFDEIRVGPPSRAYLKLWEALVLANKMPRANDRCLEIGASPGGWTWVLAKLGADVLAIDRSELAPHVAAMAGVSFVKGNAFSMTPDTVGPVDWIFSDVACYPEKLLEWVNLWLKSGACKNFICTLKFQGEGYKAAHDFANIPGSRVLHLGYNKHELTWILTN